MINSLKALNVLLPEDYDRLYETARVYESLLNNNYIYKLEDGRILDLSFTKGDFHHLIGLHKLKDIPIVNPNRRSKSQIFKAIINKDIKYSDIEASDYISDMYNRLTHFQDIKNLLFEKAIIDFDSNKLRSTKLKGDVLLYTKKLTEYNILSILFKRNKKENTIIHKDNRTICNTETFIVQHDDYYTRNQRVLKVVDFSCKKVNFKQTKI